MVRKDFRCSRCNHEEELLVPMVQDIPIGCTNLDLPECEGIMEVVFKSPPNLHSSAIPTRVSNEGISYKERQ